MLSIAQTVEGVRSNESDDQDIVTANKIGIQDAGSAHRFSFITKRLTTLSCYKTKA